MPTLSNQEIFASGGRTYVWEDVILSAWLRREWAPLENNVREGLAMVKWAEENDELPSDEELQSAAEDYRYARQLITAEETETWLEQWGLTPETWFGYLQRRMLRLGQPALLGAIVSSYQVTDDEVAGCVLDEGVCSGHLARFARELAARAAAAEALRVGSGAVTVPEQDQENEEVNPQAVFPEPIADSPKLPGFPVRPTRDRLELLARLEIRYQRFCQQVLASDAINDQIATHHLDWVRLDCESALFADEQAAREAVFCVRDDGQELSEVAARAKAVARHVRRYLEEIDPDWRPAFLAAARGDLVGPVPSGEQVELFLVQEKVMPTAADPGVRQRAERAALSGAIGREVDRHVQWQINL